MGRPKRHNYNRLSEGKRGEAVGLRKAGWTQQQIADEVGCTQPEVHYLLKKVAKTGSVSDLPRSGRPRKTSDRDDRALKIASVKNRKATAIDHAHNPRLNIKKNVSPRTGQRRLFDA